MLVLMLLTLACSDRAPPGHLKSDTDGPSEGTDPEGSDSGSAAGEGGEGAHEDVSVVILWPEDGAARSLGEVSTIRGQVLGLSAEEGWVCHWWAGALEAGTEISGLAEDGSCSWDWTASSMEEELITLQPGTAAAPDLSQPSAAIVLVGDPPPVLHISSSNSDGSRVVEEGAEVRVVVTVMDNSEAAELDVALRDELMDMALPLVQVEPDEADNPRWEAVLLDITPGVHQLEAQVRDPAGGLATATHQITVLADADNEAPDISWVSLPGSASLDGAVAGRVLEGSTGSFDFAVTDDRESELQVTFCWSLAELDWVELSDCPVEAPELPEEDCVSDRLTFPELAADCSSDATTADGSTLTCTFEAPQIADVDEHCEVDSTGALLIEERSRTYRIWGEAIDSLGASETVEFYLEVYDGESTDADGDGWSVDEGDCNDLDNTMHPGATDELNPGSDMTSQLDEDCDGEYNEDSGDVYDLAGLGDTMETAVDLGVTFTSPRVAYVLSGNLHAGWHTDGTPGDSDWYQIGFTEDMASSTGPGDPQASLTITGFAVGSSTLHLIDIKVVAVHAWTGSELTFYPTESAIVSTSAYPPWSYERTFSFRADTQADYLTWFVEVSASSGWSSYLSDPGYAFSLECPTC